MNDEASNYHLQGTKLQYDILVSTRNQHLTFDSSEGGHWKFAKFTHSHHDESHLRKSNTIEIDTTGRHTYGFTATLWLTSNEVGARHALHFEEALPCFAGPTDRSQSSFVPMHWYREVLADCSACCRYRHLSEAPSTPSRPRGIPPDRNTGKYQDHKLGESSCYTLSTVL